MSSDDGLTKFTLTPDNPCNTTLTNQNGEVTYTIVTDHTKKATTTQVRNAQEEVIGSSEWRDVLPDKVTFGSKKPLSLSEWMRRSIVPFVE